MQRLSDVWEAPAARVGDPCPILTPVTCPQRPCSGPALVQRHMHAAGLTLRLPASARSPSDCGPAADKQFPIVRQACVSVWMGLEIT